MLWRTSAPSFRRLKPQRKSRPSLFFSSFFGHRLMRIHGHSMSPQLHPGELVLVNERAYRLHPPHRGDVVAARPTALEGRALVKRLVGLPYDHVEVEGRRWQLGGGQFFLLGDQRADSMDSRTFGPVSRQELLGPVSKRIWPWQRHGALPSPSPDVVSAHHLLHASDTTPLEVTWIAHVPSRMHLAQNMRL